MDPNIAKEYYQREDIQERILHFAKDREIGVMYDGYFGKRPDIIENIFDVKNLVKKGVFSFHCSEERWLNPLLLGSEKKDSDRNNNRLGWDLILDLDGLDYNYAKIVGKIIVEYLDSIGVKSVSAKFSGNKGFHIGIPFEAFSKYNGLEETRLLFPEIPKKIALFLMLELGEKISKEILELEGSIKKIAEKFQFNEKDLINNDPKTNFFDFAKVIEIDTILITSRHLFRMPYSLHEKSGLVSIPIRKEDIINFDRDLARPELVDPKKYVDYEFLSYNQENGKDGNKLIELIDLPDDDEFSGKFYVDKKDIEQGIKSHTITKKELEGKLILSSGEEVFEIEGEIDIKDMPNTIQYILETPFEDGKKRALFVLLTYLYSINWEKDAIEELVINWNEKNHDKLKLKYIKGQLQWFNSQGKKIYPPKFENTNYYKSIGITEEILKKDINSFKNIKIKSPIHHTFIFLKRKKNNSNAQNSKNNYKKKENKNKSEKDKR